MKKILGILLMLVMVFNLCACSNSNNTSQGDGQTSSGDSDNEKKVENQVVTMWTFLDPKLTTNGRGVALAEMIKTFEANNPGVTINVESQDYTTMTAKFLAATTTNTAPDIIWCSRDELPGVLNAGALEPLENLFLGDWTDEEIEDINDGFFNYGTRDDKHYALTLSKNAVVLYYRADLFEQNGLEVPKTWDDIVEAAKVLTGTDEVSGIPRYGLGQSFSTESTDTQLLSNMILEEQGTLFNDNGTANWATESGKKALEWTVNCIDTWGITPPEAVNTTNEDLFLQFKAGKYAMIMGGGVRCSAIKSEVTFESDAVQLALIPSTEGSTNTPAMLDGWFVGVWSGSKNKEMAGKFVEHMYSPEADELWVKTGGQAPIRKSTLNNLSDYINTTENKYLAVLSQAFSNGWLPSDDLALTGWKFDLNKAVLNVKVENMSVEDALAASAKDFNDRNGR